MIRSHCNRIKALPNEISMMTTNLPSGYHRDLQLLKEHLFPALKTLKDCIEMAGLMLSNIEVKKNILTDEKYKYLFTVDLVNQLVMEGVPFRDAYIQVGRSVEDGTYTPPPPGEAGMGHEGSIQNLCTEEIKALMDKAVSDFQFEKIHTAINKLIS
ncbi:hypothetical protein [Niabella ginsengisoli]|uniref:Argininosuccinate lyase n=1 Tax=Niabella ginsengisoli TaxID=522298 RepID=A0ABS9SPQ5_9BACT|nr:hypothetical protein [Niabella ginsengisoli]MCH5600320.1 hypothetical protein [Niabella ginsengisoli]